MAATYNIFKNTHEAVSYGTICLPSTNEEKWNSKYNHATEIKKAAHQDIHFHNYFTMLLYANNYLVRKPGPIKKLGKCTKISSVSTDISSLGIHNR